MINLLKLTGFLLLLQSFVLLPSHASEADVVFDFRGQSLSKNDCRFLMKKKGNQYLLKISEKDKPIFNSKLRYEYDKDKVDRLLSGKQKTDRILVKDDYGTTNREAFTRFELVFIDDVLREVYALKYKNLNHSTRSKFVSCIL